MSVLAFLEIDNGTIKKSSQEIVSFAKKTADLLQQSVTAVLIGNINQEAAAEAGKFGAKKVVVVADSKLHEENATAFAHVLAQIAQAEESKLIILGKSGLADAIAARTAAKLKAAIVSGVIAIPEIGESFKVKRSIFTGKAFVTSEIFADTKILVVNKNSVEVTEDGETAEVVAIPVELEDQDFNFKLISKEKASGDISLTDADIIVSGGRGMKGPENWQSLLDLAAELGAATGCSKPVSDLDWRPHHEHIGQTGIKVAPNLYIACGISGAIQHLAGVNGSKNILVINKDPEAPFFKAADYGIVGDVFEVLPKLTEAIKKAK
tara:strand:+ start:637 stop:1602 length:966 start_codon:yes stop_codon:yes gene_type:complete